MKQLRRVTLDGNPLRSIRRSLASTNIHASSHHTNQAPLLRMCLGSVAIHPCGYARMLAGRSSTAPLTRSRSICARAAPLPPVWSTATAPVSGKTTSRTSYEWAQKDVRACSNRHGTSSTLKVAGNSRSPHVALRLLQVAPRRSLCS